MQPVPETSIASNARHDFAGEAETARIDSPSPDLLFWTGAGLGTTLAGGMFGFFLGGFAGIVTSWMTLKTAVGLELHAAAKSRKWQFSLGGLFSHFAAICVLLALWTLAVRALLDAREAAYIEQQENMRHLQGSPD